MHVLHVHDPNLNPQPVKDRCIVGKCNGLTIGEELLRHLLFLPRKSFDKIKFGVASCDTVAGAVVKDPTAGGAFQPLGLHEVTIVQRSHGNSGKYSKGIMLISHCLALLGPALTTLVVLGLPSLKLREWMIQGNSDVPEWMALPILPCCGIKMLHSVTKVLRFATKMQRSATKILRFPQCYIGQL